MAGHTGPVVPVDPSWLTEQRVQPWMGERSLPLWLDDPDWFGFNARDSGAAYAAGLVTRPLAETLADTLEWERLGPDQHARPGCRRRGAGPARGLALTGEERGADPRTPAERGWAWREPEPASADGCERARPWSAVSDGATSSPGS